MWPFLLLVFLSGACNMTLELVASRLVAPVLGVSLYTWTSVIGVVLAGMSAGSFVGGWMADRWNARALLGPVLIGSGMVTFLIVPANPVLGLALPAIKYTLVRVVVPVAILFGIPSFVIGLVSPLVYRICLTDLRRTGVTVGRLAAAGSLGSIAGTFATGFYLIPWFGTRAIVFGVAGTLMVLGILSIQWRRKSTATIATLLVVCLVAGGLYALPYGLRYFYGDDILIESAYYTIRVTTEDRPGGAKLKKLVLDHLIHSATDPNDPDYLWYEYERVMAWLIKNLGKSDMSALFVGGGGYTLPYWMERNYPGAQVEVIEIDPEVTKVAFKEFVPASKRIVSYNEDGRITLRNLPPEKKYDLVFGDAFNDVSVPYHLTTMEFDSMVQSHLREGGVYVTNIVDKAGGPFLSAYSATLARIFKYVSILPGSDVASSGGRSPYLILASMREIPVATWAAPPDVTFDVKAQAAPPSRLVLTDDYAPTDFLLLPVFDEKTGR